MNMISCALLRIVVLALAASLWVSLSALAASAENSVGVVVVHGKWGMPERSVNTLADALRDQGFLVTVPEMPWSGRRRYDKGVDAADAETDAEIAKLRERGAKQIFLVGHSMGAGYALHYASRTAVNGVVAVAPGHRPEAKLFVDMLGADVRKAHGLVAAGKSEEMVSFTDFNTGNRRETFKAGAAAFLAYFDPAGPMNMARNITLLKPGTPVLWMVPVREEQPARGFVVSYYKNLPSNPGNKFTEPDADHMTAPAAATTQVIEWIRATAAKN